MYDANCMCSFVEMAFGVNILMSAFEGFRDFGQRYLKTRVVQKYIAWVKTQEDLNLPDEQRAELRNLRTHVFNVNSRCVDLQTWMCRVVRVLAFIFAVLCMIALYSGFSTRLQMWCGVLILPWPAYFLSSVTVWLASGWRMRGFVRTYKDFKIKFGGKVPALMSPESIKREFGL